jgi:hypothetical protein
VRLQGEHDQDVATFCQRSVEVMGEESDNIHAQALTDALQVGGWGRACVRGGAGAARLA